MKAFAQIIMIFALLIGSVSVAFAEVDNKTSDALTNARNNMAAIAKFAEEGNADAQGILGAIYLAGENYHEALKWLEKSAAQNKPEAQHLIGCMYANGLGVPQDYQKAAEWLEKAAAQNNEEAQMLLTFIYSMGLALPAQ